MFIDDMIKDSLPLWDKASELKYVIDLYQGTLKEEALLNYIIEDSIYLFYYAKIFAYAITNCTNISEIKFFYSMMGFVNENEVNLRNEILIRNNINPNDVIKYEPRSVNKRYIDHLLHYAKNGNIIEIVAALLPCILSYNYIFNKLKKEYPKLNTQYDELTNEYLDSEYEKGCKEWIQFANEYYDNLSELEKKNCLEIFHISSELEYEFWEMFEEK